MTRIPVSGREALEVDIPDPAPPTLEDLGLWVDANGFVRSGESETVPPSGTPVPDSINSTGTGDASAALQTWLATIPNGSAVVFKAGGTYRMDHGLKVDSRQNLSFNLNGATLKANGSGSNGRDSVFTMLQSAGIEIHNGTIHGNNPNVDTVDIYTPSLENMSAIHVWKVDRLNVHDLTIREFYGDGIYIGTDANHAAPDDLKIVNNSIKRCGRNGVTLISCTNVVIESNDFDRLGGSVVDIEADYAQNRTDNVMIRDNDIGTFALQKQYTCWLLAIGGWSGSQGNTASNVSLVNNRVVGVANDGRPENRPVGLHVLIDGTRGPRTNIVVKGNTCNQPIIGPSIQYLSVTGGEISGNHQPRISGVLISTTGSTGITVSGNTP